jgi:hypothetical protein
MKSFAFVSLPLVALVLGAAPVDSRAAAIWQTDLPKAQAQANTPNTQRLKNRVDACRPRRRISVNEPGAATNSPWTEQRQKRNLLSVD